MTWVAHGGHFVFIFILVRGYFLSTVRSLIIGGWVRSSSDSKIDSRMNKMGINNEKTKLGVRTEYLGKKRRR